MMRTFFGLVNRLLYPESPRAAGLWLIWDVAILLLFTWAMLFASDTPHERIFFFGILVLQTMPFRAHVANYRRARSASSG